MLLVLIVLYLFQGSIHAVSLPFFQRDTTPTSSSLLADQCTCPNQRSVLDILWSCLAVIFACSWVSVHPNMPEPGEPRRKVALRSLELMFWAIITPELILMWAMRQWYGARILERLYREKKWTKVHGYFIQMGGFMLYEGDQARGVLSPEKLKELYEDGKIDFPTVTEEEIRDRSKADGLAKIIVVGQTTWFVAQCIARSVQRGLILAQLELVTLAFAFLNGLMYFLWWNKPMNVERSIPVYLLKVPKEKPLPLNFAPSENTSSQLKDYLLNGIHCSSLLRLGSAIWKLVKGILWIIYAIFVVVPAHAIPLAYRSMKDMLHSNSDSIKEDQMRVPTFYALEADKYLDWPLYQVGICINAVAFGAIHCAGWFLVFPSHPEGLIWKISSVIITGVPFVMLIMFLFFWASSKTSKSIYYIIYQTIHISLIFLGPLAYILARFFLLVEAFLALRALPPGAHAVIEWTSFLPHI